MSKRILVILALTFAALVPLRGAEAAPGDPASDEAQFVAQLNGIRAGRGLPSLRFDGQLTGLARGHAQTMANAGHIFHANPISAGVTQPWIKLGENVGTGPSVAPIMQAFVNSPSHFANIVDPAFTHVGVGVVWAGNQMYTTHRFMQLETAPPPPPPPPPPPSTAPAPAPAPAPNPAPAPAPAPTARQAPTTTAPAPAAPPPPAPPTATPERVSAVLDALRSAGV